jgi:hypothetical protein
VFAGTWNVGGVAPPDDLDLKDWLDTTAGSCDIYVLGYFLIPDPFDSEQCCLMQLCLCRHGVSAKS